MTTRPAIVGLILLLLAGTASARPSVEIVSPGDGACVASGLPPLPGIPGGQPVVPAVDVPLRLRLAETAGAVIDVTVTVDGVEVARDTYDPAGAAAEVTDRFAIPAASVSDGVDRRIAVTVESGGERASAAVTVTVDRTPPRVVFEEVELARLGACIGPGAPLALRYRVEDAVDPQPAVTETLETDGCAVDQVLTVRDHCGAGNAQRVPFRSRRAPAEPPRIVAEGVENGGSYLAPAIGFRVEAAAACVGGVTATLARDQEVPAPVFAGAVVEAPGQYVLTVTALTCAAEPVTSRTAFTVLPAPAADAGGPYAVAQGTPLTLDGSGSIMPAALGRIVEYAWDLDADGFFDAEEGRGARVPFDTLVSDGEYVIALRITTDQGLVEYDYTEVAVLDVTPTCDAGGPYAIEQGAALQFDATGSRAGHAMEPILAFGWDFGDDRFPQRGAGLARPTHRYDDEGDFVVTLTAEDIDSSCTARADVHVRDVEPVIRNLRARDADRLVEGVPVVFTAAQTSAGADAEPIVRFRWDFGDGSPAVEGPDLRGPSHVYARGGAYTVCLEVADVDSTVRECFEIVVADLNPLARLDGPDYAIEGEEVLFDAGRSRAGGDADPIRRFTWDFGDGSPPLVVDDPSQRQVTHVFLRDGALTVTLTVADEDSQASVTHDILVDDATPVARFTIGAEAVFEGVPVLFDAGASAPGGPGDPIAAYEWQFGDGTPVEREREVRHAFPDDGEYIVRLVVRDQDGSRAASERTVLVRNRAPANVRIVAETPYLESGRDATFRVDYEEAAGDLPRVTWSMGDGATYEGRDRVTHRFGVPGAYTVRVALDDREGGLAEARLEVTVTGAGPVLSAPAVVEGMEGRPLAFDVDVEAAADGQGGLDGPVALTVALAPPGAESTVADVGDGRARRRLHVAWTPGLIDAGDHRVRVAARSPSGIVRTAEVVLRVAESGTPMLAALGGGADGRLTLHAWRYDAVRRVDRFEIIADLPLGAGAGDLAASPGGDRVFVTLPGASALAVAATGPSPRVLRRIPIAGRPLAVVRGPDRIWVFDGVEGRLTGVDADRLKVSAVRMLRGARALVGAAVLPGGEQGDRLLAVSQATGELLVIDPEAQGEPVLARLALGGQLQRVLVDPEAGVVRVVDGKGRRLLALSAADLLAGAVPTVEVAEVPFAPRDVAVGGGLVWTAGEGGLARLDAAGVYRELRREPLESVAVLPSSLYGIPALALGSRRHVESVGAAALDTLAGVRGAGARRLLQFTRFDP